MKSMSSEEASWLLREVFRAKDIQTHSKALSTYKERIFPEDVKHMQERVKTFRLEHP